jgi:hypothetical protein
MEYFKGMVIEIYYYLIESYIGIFFQNNWGTIAIFLVIFGVFRSISSGNSDPTMYKSKRRKKKPHRSLNVTKLYE